MAVETFKPARTLKLTTPFMRGEDIKIVQRRLGEKLHVDGEYGRATASAVRAWKRRVGFPAREVNTGIGVEGQKILFGQKKRPLSYIVRSRMRAPIIKRELEAKRISSSLGRRMISMAGNYVGHRESPSGSNRVPALQDLAQKMGLATFYRNMGWPWCAFYVFLIALAQGSISGRLGLKEGKFNALYTVDILDKATNNQFGMQVISSTQVQAGDLVMMNFAGGDPRVDHVGFARGPVSGGYVPTREGNTSSSGSQDNGGMVLDKNRSLSEVRAFIRIS